jgi:hypothetical protein
MDRFSLHNTFHNPCYQTQSHLSVQNNKVNRVFFFSFVLPVEKHGKELHSEHNAEDQRECNRDGFDLLAGESEVTVTRDLNGEVGGFLRDDLQAGDEHNEQRVDQKEGQGHLHTMTLMLSLVSV